MKRGTICTVVLSNDYGKPRPALVIQSDLFSEHPSTTILPITSDLEHYPQVRIGVAPSEMNGLELPSEIMVDKIQSLPNRRIGKVIGELDAATMNDVEASIALFLAI